MQKINIQLVPINGRKSFYNKCEVLKDEKGIFYLRSYDTIVAVPNDDKQHLSKLWSKFDLLTA